MNTDEIKEKALAQTAAMGMGAAFGALTKHAVTPSRGARGGMAIQIGSAMGAAAASGAGVSGTVAAGAAVVTAKLGVVAVVGVAAAPYVAVAAVGYGIYRLFRKR